MSRVVCDTERHERRRCYGGYVLIDIVEPSTIQLRTGCDFTPETNTFAVLQPEKARDLADALYEAAEAAEVAHR